MKTLVAVDFSSVTAKIMAALESLPGRAELDVVLLHVAAPEPDFVGYGAGPKTVRDQVAGELRRERDDLHALAERLVATGMRASSVLVAGTTVDTILEQARQHGAALIVVGSHGHGAMFDLLVGSVSDGVVRHATVPVLVVPARD